MARPAPVVEPEVNLQSSQIRAHLSHLLGVVKVSEFANWRLTAATRDTNCAVLELIGLRASHGWNQLDEAQRAVRVYGLNLQEIGIRLANIQKKPDKWSDAIAPKAVSRRFDERLLRVGHVVLELHVPLTSSEPQGVPSLGVMGVFFRKLGMQPERYKQSSSQMIHLGMHSFN